VTYYDRPSGLTKAFNGLFSWLASVGLAPSKTVKLEVKGRRTGEPRTVAVNWVEHEGQRYLVAPRGNTEWSRNVKAAGGEAVIVRRGRKPVRLEELPVEQRAPIIKTYLGENALVTKREFGVEPDDELSVFEGIAERHPVFRIVEGEG
jgi:deazaflavin-dependent oxidoreductase (nitroreductase family)